MPYIGKSPSAGVRQRYQYTATAGQTTFSGTDTGNLTLTYTDNNFVDVFQNGVLLKGGGTDYTATSGTSVVLATGASVSDVIEIIVYDVFSVGNFYSRTDSDSLYVNVSGDTMTGTLALNVSGSSHLTTTTSGTSNFVLGVNAGNSIASGGNYNVALGDEAGTAITTGDENVCIGYQAGDAITTGTQNVAIGANALSTEDENHYNVAIGREALQTLNGGDYNVAVGRTAGKSVTTGYANVLVGGNCGDALTTGFNNVAIGKASLGTEDTGRKNVAVGFETLTNQNSDVDNMNVAVGFEAGKGCTTGEKNTFVGAKAGGDSTQTGDRNVGVGWEAGFNLTSGSNNIMIGHQAGRAASPSGNINSGSDTICLGDDNINDFFCNDTSISSSDSRDKADIADFNIGLNWIKDLRPVTYKWDKRSWYGTDEEPYGTPDGSKKKSKVHIGFLAQEVLEIEKANGFADNRDNMLTCNLTEDGQRYGMKYERLVPILVNAVKELSAKNDALEARIKKLEDG